MELPLVSIVVPVFNGEEFLNRLYSSLRSEKNDTIEIIFVDDGSADDSWLLLMQSVLSRDENCIVIGRHNGGISSARNAGLKIARGNYVTFLDQDDLWDVGIYNSVLYEVVKAGNIDVIGCAEKYCSENQRRSKLVHITSREYHNEGRLENARSSYMHHSTFLWRRRLIIDNDIWFIEGRQEDVVFRHMCLYCAKHIKYIDAPIFTRVNNRRSVTHQQREVDNLYYERINTWEQLKQWHVTHNPDDLEVQARCDGHIAFMLLEMIQVQSKNGEGIERISNSLESNKYYYLFDSPESLDIDSRDIEDINLWKTSHLLFYAKYRLVGLVQNTLRGLSYTHYGHKLRDIVFYS